MTGAYCASSSLLPPPLTTTTAATTTNTTTKPLKPPHWSFNSTPPLPPRKLTRRKNYLRPKILKTLPKPLILPPPPQTNPIIPIIPPPQNDTVFDDSPTLTTGGTVPVVEELERTQLWEAEGVAPTQHGEVSGNSITGNSLLRIGLGLVGVFVLQTICSVWILGTASKDEKDENLKVVEKNVNGLNEGKFLGSEEVGSFDRKRLEYRINEIRAMAREARNIEAENVGGEGEIVDEDVKFDGIGKEISARLVKVERKMGLRNGKLLGLNLNDLNGFEEDEEAKEDEEEADEDESLVFMKKFKFRSPSSIGSRSDVKGFGLDGRNVYEKKKSGFGGLSDGSMEEKKGSDALTGNVNGSRHDVEGLEKVQREKEVGSGTMRLGTVQGTSQGRSSVEVTKSQQSTDLGKQNLQKFKEESMESAFKSDRDAVNGSNHTVLGKKSDVKSDLWWMKLSYVLAILMRRGPEHEEAGFFTLRSTSQTAYTVAFESHGDANNFCHLLDLYFEDLGDFHADIVPLPVKELHDAVKSNTKKVIVVKKGQLKLYVGQPFADVEMALHSLME